MIASYEHSFVFIKTAKTAGTSIEILLSRHCGPRDVITPIDLPNERHRTAGGRGAQNFCEDAAVIAAFQSALQRGDQAAYDALRDPVRKAGFYNHMPARQAEQRLDRVFWRDALKLTVERHPYEKAVSRAFFDMERFRRPPDQFQAVLQDIIDAKKMDDRPRYCARGRPLVNRILRFERLGDELAEVLGHLGLPFPGELPRAKSGYRTDHRPAREILSDSQKELIYQGCRQTFEEMGYEP